MPYTPDVTVHVEFDTRRLRQALDGWFMQKVKIIQGEEAAYTDQMLDLQDEDVAICAPMVRSDYNFWDVPGEYAEEDNHAM